MKSAVALNGRVVENSAVGTGAAECGSASLSSGHDGLRSSDTSTAAISVHSSLALNTFESLADYADVSD
jgi:hypothetical protein